MAVFLPLALLLVLPQSSLLSSPLLFKPRVRLFKIVLITAATATAAATAATTATAAATRIRPRGIATTATKMLD